MKKLVFFFFLAVLLSSHIAQGQMNIIVKTIPSDFRIRKYLPDNPQPDSLSAVRSLNRMMAELYDDGYLAATIDTMAFSMRNLEVTVNTGRVYLWRKLRNGNIDEGFLNEAGFREKLYANKVLKPGSVSKLNEKILSWAEDHGYPFASIYYDDFELHENIVSASVYVHAENLITIDTVIINGNSRLTRTYLYNYLSVKPGDVYNESILKKIPSRLKELPMVNELRPFNVSFGPSNASLILYLEDKKSSQVDGIIGVLPGNEESGKVQITGDLRIRLLSSFGRGELFDLNWKQPQAKTQDLKVKLNYPFIFSTPFGLDLNLGIYKKDTTYLEVILGTGIQFLLKGGDYFKVFVNNKKSSLLSTKIYENTTVLPPFADITVTTYGIGYKSTRLDYRLNPRSGYSVDFSAGAGNKIIRKNGRLPELVYDSLELKSVQYNGEITFDYYFPLYNRFVMNTGIMAGGISGENTFENELYRFGGLKTLRGFDEESITTSLFGMGKLELRYILEQNSFFFLFYNTAWYEKNTRTGYLQDTPFGFGAGITFETKLGIFSFSYALGKEFNNPIRFRAAKVHFGLINYF